MFLLILSIYVYIDYFIILLNVSIYLLIGIYEVVDLCFVPMQIYLLMHVILERLEIFKQQN